MPRRQFEVVRWKDANGAEWSIVARPGQRAIEIRPPDGPSVSLAVQPFGGGNPQREQEAYETATEAVVRLVELAQRPPGPDPGADALAARTFNVRVTARPFVGEPQPGMFKVDVALDAVVESH